MMMVVMVPQEKERRERESVYRTATTDLAGQFTFNSLPPAKSRTYSWADAVYVPVGDSVRGWITSLAFLAASHGAQELLGMRGNGAKYGIITDHFYWVGAVEGMIFVGIFMMPFYWGSRARSVTEYLKLRFDEKTRALNALTFAGMTVFSSGISMYAIGLLLRLILGWSFTTSVLCSAAIVLAYTFLGGLTSAIYNEVLQFFLIVMCFSPLAIIAVMKAGGWNRVRARLATL